ncbi:hypothetical protein A9G11_10375 [Gilliamella sp. wkB108]|uniref:phosphatase PAP2 family protein n=1 Tax=Gilliamella sp. wkB108 TaxID=3120256 RepID=UPI00080E2850|nr:phosphatase PAP2 family protein [Gilliamella apicola]OCG28622.1 hypothetical protein A9G11_10375 [Gilliamella apicola]
MGLIIKKTIATLVIFLVVPLAIIAMDWAWHPGSLNSTSKYFYWITETASYPWAIISSILFFMLFCILMPVKTKKKMFFLWIILVSAILAGQVIKSIIKYKFAEPRPYVVWLANEYKINDKQFYSLPKSERKQVIHELFTNNSTTIPNWLYSHWEEETGYSFPSGHTLFVTTWAFLAIAIFGFKRHYLVVSAIILWALLIEISRLTLGMHRPSDLVLGTCIAWCITLICYFYAKKWHIVAT